MQDDKKQAAPSEEWKSESDEQDAFWQAFDAVLKKQQIDNEGGDDEVPEKRVNVDPGPKPQPRPKQDDPVAAPPPSPDAKKNKSSFEKRVHVTPITPTAPPAKDIDYVAILQKAKYLFLGLMLVVCCSAIWYLFGKIPRRLEGNVTILAKTYVGNWILVNKSYDEDASAPLLERGYPQNPVTYAINRVVVPGNTVIDVGASFGYYTMYLSYLVGPEGRVYSFEASKNIFELLNLSVRMNQLKNVNLYNNPIYRADPGSFAKENQKNEGNVGQSSQMTLDSMLPPHQDVDIIHLNLKAPQADLFAGASQIIGRSKKVKILMYWDGKTFNTKVMQRAMRTLYYNKFHFWCVESSGKFTQLKVEEVLKRSFAGYLLIARGLS